jgi:hypothetical protein
MKVTRLSLYDTTAEGIFLKVNIEYPSPYKSGSTILSSISVNTGGLTSTNDPDVIAMAKEWKTLLESGTEPSTTFYNHPKKGLTPVSKWECVGGGFNHRAINL